LQRLRALLWAAANGQPAFAPPGERVAVSPAPGVPAQFYAAVGYRLLGPKAIRVDMLERYAAEARRLSREAKDGFVVPVGLPSLLGLSAEENCQLLAALDYRRRDRDGVAHWLAPRRGAPPSRQPKKQQHRADSPFAVLRGL
jgi:ATP-dependent RNA helicase SUPV3L1/SUV3